MHFGKHFVKKQTGRFNIACVNARVFIWLIKIVGNSCRFQALTRMRLANGL